jgi:hypothetical protein
MKKCRERTDLLEGLGQGENGARPIGSTGSDVAPEGQNAPAGGVAEIEVVDLVVDEQTGTGTRKFLDQVELLPGTGVDNPLEGPRDPVVPEDFGDELGLLGGEDPNLGVPDLGGEGLGHPRIEGVPPQPQPEMVFQELFPNSVDFGLESPKDPIAQGF